MNEHDIAEQAYKNGYAAGAKEIELLQKAKQLKDAEIERLQRLLEQTEKSMSPFAKQCYKGGIKDFAENVLSKAESSEDGTQWVSVKNIKATLYEMVGDFHE